MNKTVLFRKFEERDIDFIYKCKNDEIINKMTVGRWHPFTYEEASQWVKNCMKGDRPDLKFWAICTNDEEKRIIGWLGLSAIDKENNSACFNGLVIGDKDYKDGIAQIESYLFVFEYAFETLKIHRLYGAHLNAHKMTKAMAKATFFVKEGELRDSVFKNGQYYNEIYVALLDNEYFNHKSNGDYTVKSVLKRVIKELKPQDE